jgi:hypothetical protein
MARKIGVVALFLLLSPWVVEAQQAQQFRRWEAQIAKYKEWLDTVGPDTYRFWVRLDSQSRPHRLYVGEGFYKTDDHLREEFVDTFSRYLAGHPEKFMLIDIFDAASEKQIGEFGWGGFKLYPASISNSRELIQAK